MAWSIFGFLKTRSGSGVRGVEPFKCKPVISLDVLSCNWWIVVLIY
jgi:hypothetical protein